MSENIQRETMGPEEQREEIDWNETRQQTAQILQKYIEDSGDKRLNKDSVMGRLDNFNNFTQYFPYEDGQKVSETERGIRVSYLRKVGDDNMLHNASPEENGTTTLRERFENHGDTIQEAESIKDFFAKKSKKFLDTSVAQFFRDVDEALALAGITEEDLQKNTYGWSNPNKKQKDEKQALVARAYQYLVAVKGYNYCDLCA